MRLLQIYNQYRSLFGGEETVVNRISGLVEKYGGQTRLMMRSSRGLADSPIRKARAFFSGVYNPFAGAQVLQVVSEFRPDVVHVHNLYPLFSPSVLVSLRRAGIPIVMTVHNHLHTCPNLDHLRNGEICESCVGGREYHCVLHNCRSNRIESAGYALRSATARIFRLFTDNVTVVIALNEFARERLIAAGFPADNVTVLPNMVEIAETPADPRSGEYVVYSGRMSPEKGVSTLLESARLTPEIPIRLLGDGPSYEKHRADAPPNAEFVGRLSADQVEKAYRAARMMVVPSRWFEGCPLVISEGMSYGLPVIASRIGGLPELVDDGVTGCLFEPGNVEELAQKMTEIWSDPARSAKMGAAGREKAEREFGEAIHWNRLKAIYDEARTRVRAASKPRRRDAK